MDTRVVRIDANNMDHKALKRAGALIREGGLVAFPTETVYGLGANGLDAGAVKGIFKAKGRPSDNPLILHISRTEELDRLVACVPAAASKLIDRFWPGPLTLVLKKSPLVPEAVTAGLDTVAVRMPSHPIAARMIYYAGVPVAAPSANLSGKPSPTRISHVLDDLMGRVDMIIDGGDVSVGLESTVAEVTPGGVSVLRPGGITVEQIRQVVGNVFVDPALENGNGTDIPRSPGMKYTHYSPEAEVIIIDGIIERVVGRIQRMSGELEAKGRKVGILATEQTRALYRNGTVISAGDREKPCTIAASLFAALREFDRLGVDIILAEAVERDDMGLAIMNRLLKAASYNIIRV
jgi:L-threonylcarbamoyladenylate synthase